MTICVAIQVSDCIVFAADSASSMIGVDVAGNPVVSNIYNYGRKVFCLHKRLPVMAMTCGMGSIAGSSIDVIAKDFRTLLMGDDASWSLDKNNYTIEEIAQKAQKYFHDDQYQNDPNKPTGVHSFELFIGGHSAGLRHGEIWKISIVNGVTTGATCVSPAGNNGIVWAGQPEAINRLVLGFGGAVPEVLQSAGIVEPELSALIAAIRSRTSAELTHPAMPVQDAIDLATFLVDTTIGFTKFLPGSNTVGGDVDVATVTRHEGFKWVKRKHFYPAELNPLETDHVGGR